MHECVRKCGIRRRIILRCSFDYYAEFVELIGELTLQKLLHTFQSGVAKDCARGEHIIQTFPEGFVAAAYAAGRQDLDCRVERWEQHLRGIARAQRIPYTLSLSAGVCEELDEGVSLPECVQKAAFAQRCGQIFTNPSVRYYDVAASSDMMHDRYLELGMHTALHEHQFEVYFQPQYRLPEKRLSGAEALVRWQHPELGLLSPNSFIPLFEQNRFILRLDFYMLEECCRAMERWKQRHYPVPLIAVNFSRLHAATSDFTNRFLAVTQKYHIKPDGLCVEWTESAFSMCDAQLCRIAGELRNNGFRVAMDDFGAGGSSLNALAEMPVDLIKLDKRFLQFEHMDRQRSFLLTHMVHILRHLDYEVLAEGVENGWQAELIQNAGCEYVQGYLFDRPLPLSGFERRLTEQMISPS